MRAIITNFGTRGDFEPLLNLADEFTSHGHETIFAIPEFAESMVRERGFSSTVIAPDVAGLRDEVNLLWANESDAYNFGEPLLRVLSPLRSLLPQTFSKLADACSKASVLISGPAQPVARAVSETTGIPFVSVQFSHFGGNGGPALKTAGEEVVNSFRQGIGLPPIADPFTRGANSPQMALYAMSTYLRPRPISWPSHFHFTGFFFPEVSRNVPESLVEFVENDTKPIVITFGSMPHANESNLHATVVEAVRRTRRRAVVLGLQHREVEDDQIYWADSVPHEWLFPRSACIVAHGGAGTSAQIFRSGIPGVFVPHGDVYDQRYWAQLAYESGCAVPAVPLGKLEAGYLADAIAESIANPAIVDAAARLGAKIRSEHGVGNARRLIENLVDVIGLESAP